jgi:uncharacterized protein YegJ (DUF2314 family)
MKGQAFLAALVLSVPACSEADPYSGRDPEATATGLVNSNDPAMRAAIARTRSGLPGFLDRLERPPPGAGGFAVKFPLGGWEHVWVTGISRHDEMIVGHIASDPLQSGHARGDVVRVPISAISDWAWRDGDGHWHGYHTRRDGPGID